MSDRHNPDVGCAALHTDSQGDAIPCPGDHPEPPPELSELEQLRADNESLRYMVERARWALGTDEPVDDRLLRAEIRAGVAEHQARAYREQVQALIRSIQRDRGVPEDELADGDAFVVVAERRPDAPEVDAQTQAGDTYLAELVLDTLGIDIRRAGAGETPDWPAILATSCRELRKSEAAREHLRETRDDLVRQRGEKAEKLSSYIDRAVTAEEQLAEARMWARHGYEIGQRHCSWADAGVAPSWLTEGWPPHFDSCEHFNRAAEYDAAISRVRGVSETPEAMNADQPNPDVWKHGYRIGVLAAKDALRSPYEKASKP